MLQLVQIGLPDTFVDQGDPILMLASVGLDATGIEATIRAATRLAPDKLVPVKRLA